MSFSRYPKYKASGVEWLGDVPAHWNLPSVRRLLTRIEQGWSPECDARPAEPGEWGVLKAGCVNRGTFDPSENKVLPSDKEPLVELEVRPGDLLMSRASGSPELVGSTALVRSAPGRLMLSDKIFRLHAANVVQPAFLAWSFGSRPFRHQIERAISGGDGLANNLPQSALLGFACPCPSSSEQIDIAAFLDRETEKIDALVAEQQRLIELLKEKRQAVISHAVTKGLDPKAKMKPSGIEWLGDVPAHWEVKRLKHVSPFLSVGIVINPSSLVADEGLPFIYGGDIREGVIDWGNARRITPEASHLHAKTVLEDGDLLVVRVGAPGVTAVVPAECAGGNCASVMLMRRGNFNSRWLCSLMNTRVVRFQVEGAQYGAAQEQFNISDAVNFWVPVPPREEQDQIQAHCDNAAGQFDKLVEGAKMAITLLQERRTALISAAVTGQIDVRSLEPRGSLECNAGSKKDDASLTISEAAFEAFCTDVSIPFVRIPRKQNERTADYLVNSGAQQFVVELKQFDPNEEEEAAIAARAEGKIVAQGGVPGSRIRLAIQNAAPQLKLSSGGRLPAMLVVYNCTGVNMHTDPYSVATAMQGLDVIDIAVPAETSESPNFGPPRSGPKKKMTANSHTSISAIAVLGDNLDGRMRLDVFHNRHAKNPLDPDKLRGPRVHHWRLPDGARSSLVEWDPV